MKVKQLKEQRGAKMQEMKALADAADNENRNMTADEATKFDALDSEIKELDAEIRRAERAEEIRKANAEEAAKSEARAAASAAGGAVNSDGLSESDKKDFRNYSFTKALRSAVTGKLDGFEKEMHEEALNELRSQGLDQREEGSVLIPTAAFRHSPHLKHEKRDMTAGTGTEGGFNVPTDGPGYITALRNRSLTMQLGLDVLTDLRGSFPMARENNVFEPEWRASENATAAEQSPTYEQVEFKPNDLAGYIDVSNKLLMQTSGAIEARLVRQILDGYAIAIDKAVIAGTGSSGQPTGVINDSDVTVEAIGTDGGAITLALVDKLLEIIELANGDTSNMAYLTTPQVKTVLRNLKLDTGSGLFVWDRLTNTINGIQALVSNNVPSNLTKGAGTDLNAMILGDFSGAAMGQWGALEVQANPYTKMKNNQTEMVLNAYADVHVLQPGRFAAIKDIDVS